VREKRDDAGYDDAASTGAGAGEETGEPTIVIEDEGLRLGFTQLPNYLFQVRGLSHSAKLTYALILSYAWQKDYCFPGQETLARDLEVSTRSVIEYLKELQGRGLIRIQRRGLGKTNIYHVLRYPPPQDSTPREPLSHQEVKRSSHQGLKQPARLDTTKMSHPEVRRTARPEVQRPARNKKTPPAKNTTENEKGQQEHAATRGQGRDGRGKRTGTGTGTGTGIGTGIRTGIGTGIGTQDGLFAGLDDGSSPTSVSQTSSSAGDAAMARAALQAHGIRNERLLAELTADPGEALAQIERLREEVARGVVGNPAGWLVEAIRGRYRPADEAEAETPERTDAGVTATSQLGKSSAPRAEGAASSPEDRAWARVCAELRGDITPENYRRWFAPAVAQGYTGDRLTVGVPDAFHLQWLDRRLRGAIERAAARVLGDVAIAFVVAGRA